MARLPRHYALILAALLALLPARVAAQEAPPGLYDRPVLALDPGRHTAPIWRADVDAARRFAVTGSDDRTVRVWELGEGRLIRTIRMPVGPGHVGKVFAVAISPDGETIAAGGWTGPDGKAKNVYLFDRATGAMIDRLSGLPDVVNHLAFAPSEQGGARLAAVLNGPNGVRVYDRGDDGAWHMAWADPDYGGSSYGVAFGPGGRIATTSYDGRLRLYDAAGAPLKSVETNLPRPYGLAFNPVDGRLAVGFDRIPALRLYDGTTLDRLASPDTAGIGNGDLIAVTWSADGATLYAGGQYNDGGGNPVLAWDAGGTGARRVLPAGDTTVMSLQPLPGGALLAAAADPWLGVIAADGTPRWTAASVQTDFRAQLYNLAVSADGQVVEFGPRLWGATDRRRFDLAALRLGPAGGTADVHPPDQESLDIADWVNRYFPTLDGAPLPLERYEWSRSLAIHPDGARFVLGTEWSLRAFDADGSELWRRGAPGIVWAVNISGDGRLVVAAHGDGTLRWHRMEDGAEILALFPFTDGRNWVAWTPEGYFHATEGARAVLGWHVNRGWDSEAGFYPVSTIPGFDKPQVLKGVLREGETARALGLAILAEDRIRVQKAVDSTEPPGAQLHVLAIGISDYARGGELTLNYADDDARALSEKLLDQEGGLYTKVNLTYLPNEQANSRAIRRALRALEASVQTGQNDVAVILFSGHGEMANGRYYLLPWDVETDDAIAIEDTGLRIDVLREAVGKIGQTGKVLVLLDSCRSGDAVETVHDLRRVRESLARAGSGVVVITSSSGAEVSVEREPLGNGVFTEAVLEALDPGRADRGDGRLTASELQDYVYRRVRELTGNRQTPQLSVGGQNFFNIELFVTALR